MKPSLREGDWVRFRVTMASGAVKTYCGHVHKQIAGNLFQVVGYGFVAELTPEQADEIRPGGVQNTSPRSVLTTGGCLDGGPGHQNASCGHGDTKKGHL